MRFKLLLEKITYSEAMKLFGFKGSYTKDQVNKQFKKLAIMHHPDRGGSTEEMQDVNDAREILLKSASYPTDDSKKKPDAYEYSKEEKKREADFIQKQVLDTIDNFFSNLNEELFKFYFQSIFGVPFTYSTKSNLSDKKPDLFKWVEVEFRSSDGSKIISFDVSVDYYRLSDTIRKGTTLDNGGLYVYYQTDLFIDGKKQKVKQTLYNNADKVEILTKPEVMFPSKKLNDIINGKTRKNTAIKKADFESLFLKKYKGSRAENTYYIPITTAKGVKLCILRPVIMRVGTYSVYCVDVSRFMSDVKEPDELRSKATSIFRGAHDLCETPETLEFFDSWLEILQKTSVKDLPKQCEKMRTEMDKLYKTTWEDYERSHPKMK